MQREPAEVIGYDANAMTIKELKSVLSEFGVALPVSTQAKVRKKKNFLKTSFPRSPQHLCATKFALLCLLFR
jgi:hypothetical protein